jgi:hypothetical protein
MFKVQKSSIGNLVFALRDPTDAYRLLQWLTRSLFLRLLAAEIAWANYFGRHNLCVFQLTESNSCLKLLFDVAF